ncbi:MAG: ArsR family transcriptional regulator [Nevskiaceae bacterium]|nr:MAG: ArsR family transcriptional regulator [Nevskiaceae bacterium]TBR71529.1 MAG: ArsR family transcriptional regulator [Nevskiaceae bacterium]
MSSPGPKQRLLTEFATLAKAIAQIGRLRLLEQLAQGERTVETLAMRCTLSVANTSRHLQQLRRSGLVTSHREGKFVYYALADDSVLDLLGALQRVAEHTSAEVANVVRSYFAARDALEPVSREELLARLKDGAVTVLDVRPEDEYALGHLPRAVNLPLDRLRQRLADLDPAQPVVAYCRGPYCVLSFEAVALLREHGYEARRLQDGYPQWKAAGLPVALGATGA